MTGRFELPFVELLIVVNPTSVDGRKELSLAEPADLWKWFYRFAASDGDSVTQ